MPTNGSNFFLTDRLTELFAWRKLCDITTNDIVVKYLARTGRCSVMCHIGFVAALLSMVVF